MEMDMEVTVPKFCAMELDTGNIVEGYYYLENGYWMSCGKPDYNHPVQRHKIVTNDGIHVEIAEGTLSQID